MANLGASRVDRNWLCLTIDHLLQPHQSLPAQVEDLAPDTLFDQTKHNLGGTVGVEKLQLAAGVQKQRASLENVVNGVLLQAGADESSAPQDQPIVGGMLHALLGQAFVEAVRSLIRGIQLQFFAGTFRRRAVGVDVAGRDMHVALVTEVFQTRANTADRGVEILFGVPAGQDLAGVAVGVDQQVAGLADAGGVVFTMNDMERLSGFLAIPGEAGSDQPPAP